MKRIIERVRGYETSADRKRAIAQLFKRGWTRFVCYRDTQAEFALMFSKPSWVPADTHQPHVDW